MKVTDILNSGRSAFPSIEIIPPLGGLSKDSLIGTVSQLMEFRPPYINVTSHRDEFRFEAGPDGTFTRHLVRNRVSPVTVCCAVKAEFRDVEVVPHIICAGRSAEEIESEFSDLRFLGFENIMALRGDSMAGEKRFTPEPGGYSHASELVRAAREFGRDKDFGFCIGVGGYPEKHFEAANIETDIENLRRKVDEGADYIITQMFFDNAVFYDFERRCREAGITVPIIPGLKPLSTPRQIELLPQSFSLDIPFELTEAVREASGSRDAVYEIGIEWCARQCRDLLAHGVPAVHFYTMGKADNVARVLKSCF